MGGAWRGQGRGVRDPAPVPVNSPPWARGAVPAADRTGAGAEVGMRGGRGCRGGDVRGGAGPGWGGDARGAGACAGSTCGGRGRGGMGMPEGRGRAQALTKQMPARRRGTRVHTLVGRHWAVTTVTLSCCSTLAVGRFVPSWPQPMARQRTPLPTPWPCRGSWATRTLALMVADPLSCGGQERAPGGRAGRWARTLRPQTPFPRMSPPHGPGRPRGERPPAQASVSPAVKQEQPRWLRASPDASESKKRRAPHSPPRVPPATQGARVEDDSEGTGRLQRGRGLLFVASPRPAGGISPHFVKTGQGAGGQPGLRVGLPAPGYLRRGRRQGDGPPS